MQIYKTQLQFGTEAARAFWVERMRLIKDCYNFAAKIAFDEQLPLGIKPFHHRLYRPERDSFPNLPAQMCVKVYKQVLANYRTVRGNKVELKTPLKMKRPSVRLDKLLYARLTPESICLSACAWERRHKVKFVHYSKFDEMAAKYKMKDPVLQYNERKDRFFLCVPFDTPDAEPLPESYLGVDLGIKRSATLSDGTAIVDKAYLARRRRIRHNKSELRRHKKHSHSARRKLKAIRHREKNMSKDFCHHLANEILKHNGSIIVMEDLSNIKRNTSTDKEGNKRKRHNNKISQVPFFQLKQILTNKAPLVGKRVETVSPEYTSQEDCRTGSREACKRQGCRFYTADGLVFDADWNAAINICNRKHPTSFSLPLDGRLNIVGRRSQHANSWSGATPPANPHALAMGS